MENSTDREKFQRRHQGQGESTRPWPSSISYILQHVLSPCVCLFVAFNEEYIHPLNPERLRRDVSTQGNPLATPRDRDRSLCSQPNVARVTVDNRATEPSVSLSLGLAYSQEMPTEADVPAYPMLMDSGETTDLSDKAGAVGILLNGVALFRLGTRELVDPSSSRDFRKNDSRLLPRLITGWLGRFFHRISIGEAGGGDSMDNKVSDLVDRES